MAKPETAQRLTVSDAAARLDVTARTLKYYEELGIVVPARSPAGYRLYSLADLDRLARVLRMRSLGFSLMAITAMLQQPMEVPAAGGRPRLSRSSLEGLRATLASQLTTLDARVAQVRRELRDAGVLQAELRRDLDYVAQRLAGAPVEAALAQRGREQGAEPR